MVNTLQNLHICRWNGSHRPLDASSRHTWLPSGGRPKAATADSGDEEQRRRGQTTCGRRHPSAAQSPKHSLAHPRRLRTAPAVGDLGAGAGWRAHTPRAIPQGATPHSQTPTQRGVAGIVTVVREALPKSTLFHKLVVSGGFEVWQRALEDGDRGTEARHIRRRVLRVGC
jgi:hypothetical protein